MNKVKLYITGPGETGMGTGEGPYVLVSETGEALCSHYCSSKGFAKGDLIEGRPERIEKFTEKFGEYEVLFLGEDDMVHEELYKRNQEWMASIKENNNEEV